MTCCSVATTQYVVLVCVDSFLFLIYLVWARLYSLLFYYVAAKWDDIRFLVVHMKSSLQSTLFLSWQVFRNSLHPPDYQSRLEIVRANSKLSLNRTGTSMSKSGTMQVSASPYFIFTFTIENKDRIESVSVNGSSVDKKTCILSLDALRYYSRGAWDCNLDLNNHTTYS